MATVELFVVRGGQGYPGPRNQATYEGELALENDERGELPSHARPSPAPSGAAPHPSPRALGRGTPEQERPQLQAGK